MKIKSLPILFSCCVIIIMSACQQKPETAPEPTQRYIKLSAENPAYFAYSDHSPYIPIGINLINPSGRYQENPDSAFIEIESWMKNLSENGGNYIRIWLSQSFWDIETEAGKYSEEKAKRIDRFIELARTYQLKIKITFEHFRSLTVEENAQPWATKFVYHTSNGGPLDSIRQYLTSTEGKQLFLNKIDFYKNRYGSDTLFFGLELWNEMNAMKGPEDSVFFAWNTEMLRAVKERFPDHLVMQSLGSFDTENVRSLYQKMMLLPDNQVAQIHRYLDLGARMPICQASMDVIAASAIEEVLSYEPGKPVILAETGAVEPKHSGPSRYYRVDTAGSLLHDLLFAPFFAGSAGAGMSWHWESYVHKNHLWHHFARFREAIKGLNPIQEAFKPGVIEMDSLRIYLLQGNKTTLIWIRDKMNDWKSELDQGITPRIIRSATLDVSKWGPTHKMQVYDPWKNAWSTLDASNSLVMLPDFKRSLIIRME